MQLEKDETALTPELADTAEVPEAADAAQDRDTQWLLERDMADPVDSLFAVQEDKFEASLSAHEAEIAGRPMFREQVDRDDLSAFFAEEIVMSEVGGESDIYTASNTGVGRRSDDAELPLTIDHKAGFNDAEFDPECAVEDGADILSLSDEDDMGDYHLVLVASDTELDPQQSEQTVPEPEPEPELEPELELELEELSSLGSEPDLDSDLEIELQLDPDPAAEFVIGLELDLKSESVPEKETMSAVDPTLEEELYSSGDFSPSFKIDQELNLQEEPGEPADTPEIPVVAIESVLAEEPPVNQTLDADLEKTPENELQGAGKSVLEYISSTPAPTDEDEFDEYLLAGQQFEGVVADSSALTIAPTEGVSAVDPVLEECIDYHEDFHQIEGFNDSTLSTITGVIAQVMEEVTSAVNSRLAELSIDQELVQVEAMLANDVESIIECVTDGYAPIIDIRPDLPAALRQLGQSEVDAIYLRISHSAISGNWNALFQDDFVVPGNTTEAKMFADGEGDSSPQPFASFDLDEFDFDEPEQNQGVNLSADDIDDINDELDSFSEFSSDDPLASIDFGAITEEEVEDEFQAGFSATSTSNLGNTDDDNLAPTDAERRDSVVDSASWCIPGNLRFSSSNADSTELFEEFLDVFIEEATLELEKFEDAIGSWEAASVAVSEVPVAISHSLHTLKGIAKGVGLHRYGTLIHNYETLLDGLALPVDEGSKLEYFQIVNAWLDAVVQGFETIEKSRTDVVSELPSPEKVPARGVSEAGQAVEKVVGTEQASTSPKAKSIKARSSFTKPSSEKLVDAPVAKPASVAQTDQQLADEGANALAAQQSIRMTSGALDNLLNLTNQAQQLGVRSSESAVRSKHAAAESLARLSSVRAHIVKIADRALSNVTAKDKRKGGDLDALEMDQYSELQEAANILRESVEDLDDLIRVANRQISMSEALLKQQSSVISSLGSSIQAVRVVPVSRLFPGLRRIVRTLGADLDKTVSFKVLKQAGTLDRDNHARCQVILEHMVRNAMDHGIESPEKRLEQGKPASGTISVDVNKKGADYIITLSDDGCGVDPDLMRETAHQRGLDIDIDALSDDEAIRLIFYKGFTTASSVSEISGRGVGMDIVLSELQKIGGDVEIESVVGEGTRFHIRIPPNVSVNGALLVSAGERSYAIPLDGLVAVDYVDVDTFYGAAGEKTKLSLAGMDCDPAYLATLCHGASLPEKNAWAKSVPVLIAGSKERYMAIAVDDVKQALELVIRSLGVQFSGVPGVSGATTTADGQAVVALDLNAMVDSVGSEELSSMSPEQVDAEQLLVMVVDDSRTQRMVSTSQFDTLGVETITAENGMVAIDFLNTGQRLPDIILLDVEMPVKDGIQTLREIRKSTRYSHIPVIMVTSRTGTKHRALADEAGCDGYMGKPFNFPVLVEQISQLTGHKLEIS